MPDGEPQKVKAIRVTLAELLGIDPDEIELLERRMPGSDEDAPDYVTLRIPRSETYDDDAVNAAVLAVNDHMWQHPAYPTQLRWEYKP